MIVENHFTRQYNPEDNSEQENHSFTNNFIFSVTEEHWWEPWNSPVSTRISPHSKNNCDCLLYILAVLWSRRLVAILSPRKPGFAPGTVRVGFVVTKWHWDRFFPQVLWFYPVSIVSPWLHTRISSDGWIVGALVGPIQRHGLTPLTWTSSTTIHVSSVPMTAYYCGRVSLIQWCFVSGLEHDRRLGLSCSQVRPGQSVYCWSSVRPVRKSIPSVAYIRVIYDSTSAENEIFKTAPWSAFT
jgi:hypothetical protein